MAGMGWDRNVVEELDRQECLRLLAAEKVGRFVFTTGGLPAVRPVAYVLEGEDILVRTRPGTNVTSCHPGTVVAFEVDDLDPVSGTGWSITVTGNGRVLADAETAPYRGVLPRPWVAEATELIVLPVELVHGQRIRHD